MVATLTCGVMAIVCFCLWRREAANHDTFVIQQKQHWLELQIKCGQLNESQKQRLQEDLQLLRSYVLEVKNYRDMRERLLADRISNIESAVKALGVRIKP